MFKVDWEKTSIKYQLPEGIVEKMVRLAYPYKKLTSSKLISGGCANLNFKIQLKTEKHSLILRVYLRDTDAAYREQNLAALLKKTVPVPLTHYIGEFEGYHFAITEFMPGLSLRDLLLGDAPHDLGTTMHEVGLILSRITAHEFSEAGFFDKELNIIAHSPSDDYLTFAKDCLSHETVLSVLTSDVIIKITQVLAQSGHLFPDENEKHLVHADFDPANILVHKIDGLWKVSGILDWEFAFSGSVLCDVANMLRYAHKIPHEFQDAFLKGLADGGVTLPENWRVTVNLLNILSLMDVLQRSDPKNSPNQCTDISELIDHILSELNHMKKIDRIEIAPYDTDWPNIFKAEAALIKEALGENCIEIHHVGSTSVPGLAAKPVIDMIPVVRDIMLVDAANLKMADLGYEIKGEYGMLFRRYFKKIAANIHVYEKGSGEIDRCIKFRDWMCFHLEDREAYSVLKNTLAKKHPNDILSYCFGKNDFVAGIDKKTGFSGLRVVKALTPTEWATAKHFRDTYFFGPHGIDDPYTWTFNHSAHAHLVLYQACEIVGYAHIQFWPDQRAAIRIIAVDEDKRNQNSGSQFLALIEKWLKSLGVKSIHAESRQTSLRFYLKNGYTEMLFNDPENHESDPNDVPVGKLL